MMVHCLSDNMKKILVIGLFAISVFLMACTEDEPNCIDDMIEEFKSAQADRSFVGIYQFQLEGETFYIFDSGVAFDATASVVDEECQQVCIYGGFRANSPQPCDDFWDGINNSTQIWPE